MLNMFFFNHYISNLELFWEEYNILSDRELLTCSFDWSKPNLEVKFFIIWKTKLELSYFLSCNSITTIVSFIFHIFLCDIMHLVVGYKNILHKATWFEIVNHIYGWMVELNALYVANRIENNGRQIQNWWRDV